MNRVERRALQRAQKREKRKRLSGIAGNIFYVCLAVVLCTLVFFLAQSWIDGGPPTVAGYRLFAVLSGSMKPEFNPGSLIAVKPVEPGELRVGDIITFETSIGTMVTHRIVEIETEGGLRFLTKGDANDIRDPVPVPAARVIGIVSAAFPFLGRILMFIQTRKGLLLLIMIPAMVVIALEARHVWRFLAGVDGHQEKSE